MAEFRYYAIHADVFDWLTEIASFGEYTFALYLSYDEPRAIEFKEPSKLDMQKFHMARNVYLYSEKYSVFPLFMGGPYIKSDGTKWYDISSLIGGPCLHMSISPMWEESPNKRTNFVDLSYQPYFRNPADENDWRKPPETLKEAYKKIRSLLQRRCVKGRIDFGEDDIQTGWFGRHTFEMIQAGELFIDQGISPAIGVDKIKVIKKASVLQTKPVMHSQN